MSIEAYLHHLHRRGLTDGTIERRSYALRSFERWLAKPLIETTTADINRFLDGKRDEIVDKTTAGWISHLSCYFAWAELEELCPRNPAARVERPRLERYLPRPIGEADFAMAMDAAGTRMSAWLVLGGFAGLRCMEIASLHLDSVMRHENVLRIIGKGRKERIVPIHPAVDDALLVHGLPKRGAVFTNGRRQLWPREVSQSINQYLAGLGIAATAHMLRHRFGTATYAVCRDLRVVQELMGHADPKTTAGYAAYSKMEAHAAVAGIPMPGGNSSLDDAHRGAA